MLKTGNITYRNRAGYKIDITITCCFNTYDGYTVSSSTVKKNTQTHTIIINNFEDIQYQNLNIGVLYGCNHINGTASGTPAVWYTIDNIVITKL